MIEITMSQDDLGDRLKIDAAIETLRSCGGGILRFPGGTFDIPTEGIGWEDLGRVEIKNCLVVSDVLPGPAGLTGDRNDGTY